MTTRQELARYSIVLVGNNESCRIEIYASSRGIGQGRVYESPWMPEDAAREYLETMAPKLQAWEAARRYGSG